jgi:DNA-binding LacI/PurR family transcriptional regulator
MLVFEGLGAIVQSGRRIGEDVGVIAVASEERPWTALLPTPIPLLEIPAREIGRRAGSMLLRRFGEPAAEPVIEVVPMRLVSSGDGA